MKRLFATVAVAAALVGSNASAFDPADLKKLKETNECATEFEIWSNAKPRSKFSHWRKPKTWP
jgi:hypothetical protein